MRDRVESPRPHFQDIDLGSINKKKVGTVSRKKLARVARSDIVESSVSETHTPDFLDKIDMAIVRCVFGHHKQFQRRRVTHHSTDENTSHFRPTSPP